MDNVFGKGARAWSAACIDTVIVSKKLYNPVKTRFGSVLLMMKRLYDYRSAVEIFYGQ